MEALTMNSCISDIFNLGVTKEMYHSTMDIKKYLANCYSC